MSTEKDKNILSIKDHSGTIEVKPHPEEIIDVAPEILALMEARLNGQSFIEMYGDEDKVSQEFLIRKETEKLKRVFGTGDQVSLRFQSVKLIKDMRQELQFEEVNRKFLGEYALKKTGRNFVDECDLYTSLISGTEMEIKTERLKLFESKIVDSGLRELLISLKLQYLEENLEPIQITKEIIQIDPLVLSFVKNGVAVEKMNQLLANFYRGKR